MNGISALIRETPESFHPFCHWAQGEESHVQMRKWSSPETKAARTLSMGSPASRTTRNKFLLFMSPTLVFLL